MYVILCMIWSSWNSNGDEHHLIHIHTYTYIYMIHATRAIHKLLDTYNCIIPLHFSVHTTHIHTRTRLRNRTRTRSRTRTHTRTHTHTNIHTHTHTHTLTHTYTHALAYAHTLADREIHNGHGFDYCCVHERARIRHLMWDSYVWHDSLICVIWLIHMTDGSVYECARIRHLYVWHDSLICVTWLIHMCDMTHSYMCDMTPSHAW